jgi:hypothetical protein
MSATPRFLSSVITFSQNFAPSVCSTQIPSTSFVADLHAQRIEDHHGVQRIERPVLPLLHLVEHRVRDRADQVRAHLDAVQLLQVALDLAHRHPACVQRQHLLVETLEPSHALRYQLRLERAGPIARHLDRQLAVLGDQRLGRRAVAVVALALGLVLALRIAQVMRQLSTQRPLHQRLLQRLQEPVRPEQILRSAHALQQLVQHLLRDLRPGASVLCHIHLRPSVDDMASHTNQRIRSAARQDALVAPQPGR